MDIKVGARTMQLGIPHTFCIGLIASGLIAQQKKVGDQV